MNGLSSKCELQNYPKPRLYALCRIILLRPCAVRHSAIAKPYPAAVMSVSFLLIHALCLPIPCSLRGPEVHGHRGCRGLRPENTLPAFLHALALGVDVLELDVVISADKQVVVSHEPWLNPLICLGPDGQPIAAYRCASLQSLPVPYATIRRCDCGQLRHPAFPEQSPQPAYKPLLREVLAATRSSLPTAGPPPGGYSIEIKSSPEGDDVFHPAPAEFLALVLAELARRPGLGPHHAAVFRCAHSAAWLTSRQPALPPACWSKTTSPGHAASSSWALCLPRWAPIVQTVYCDAVREFAFAYPSLRLVPWTVNEPADMQRLLPWASMGLPPITPTACCAMLATATDIHQS